MVMKKKYVDISCNICKKKFWKQEVINAKQKGNILICGKCHLNKKNRKKSLVLWEDEKCHNCKTNIKWIYEKGPKAFKQVYVEINKNGKDLFFCSKKCWKESSDKQIKKLINKF